jgi:hypothetical protein
VTQTNQPPANPARFSAGAEPGLGRGGDLLGVMGSKCHVVLVVSVGDETARHPVLFRALKI